MKLLCFEVAGQGFGIPITAVKETLAERPLTRLGLVPAFVAGLINLRGEVVAVLDLALLLQLPESAARRASVRNLIILRGELLPGSRHHAVGPAAGLLCDRLDGVTEVDPAALKPPPSTLAAEPLAYLDGVVGRGDPPRPLLVLAAERVLGTPQLSPFRRETH